MKKSIKLYVGRAITDAISEDDNKDDMQEITGLNKWFRYVSGKGLPSGENIFND